MGQLTFSDIDYVYKETRLNETKTGSPRNIHMHSELFEHMKTQWDEARKKFRKEDDYKFYRDQILTA